MFPQQFEYFSDSSVKEYLKYYYDIKILLTLKDNKKYELNIKNSLASQIESISKNMKKMNEKSQNLLSDSQQKEQQPVAISSKTKPVKLMENFASDDISPLVSEVNKEISKALSEIKDYSKNSGNSVTIPEGVPTSVESILGNINDIGYKEGKISLSSALADIKNSVNEFLSDPDVDEEAKNSCKSIYDNIITSPYLDLLEYLPVNDSGDIDPNTIQVEMVPKSSGSPKKEGFKFLPSTYIPVSSSDINIVNSLINANENLSPLSAIMLSKLHSLKNKNTKTVKESISVSNIYKQSFKNRGNSKGTFNINNDEIDFKEEQLMTLAYSFLADTSLNDTIIAGLLTEESETLGYSSIIENFIINELKLPRLYIVFYFLYMYYILTKFFPQYSETRSVLEGIILNINAPETESIINLFFWINPELQQSLDDMNISGQVKYSPSVLKGLFRYAIFNDDGNIIDSLTGNINVVDTSKSTQSDFVSKYKTIDQRKKEVLDTSTQSSLLSSNLDVSEDDI